MHRFAYSAFVIFIVLFLAVSVSTPAQVTLTDADSNGTIAWEGILLGSTAQVEIATFTTVAGVTNWIPLAQVPVEFPNMDYSAFPVVLRVVGQPETNSLLQGLVAWYPFNGNANDESGYGNNGVVNGAMLVADRFGTPSEAYDFSGLGDAIEVGELEGADLTSSDYTISFWIDSDAIEEWRNPFDANFLVGDGNKGPRFEHVPGGGLRTYVNGVSGPLWYSSLGPLSTGAWYHVVLINEGSQLTTYLNAQPTWNRGNGSMNGFENVVLGRGFSTDPERYYDGTLDDVRIYNRALSSNEVWQLYNVVE